MANWLENTTVVITGASGGLGKGIAMKLIQKFNCTVIGIARNEEKMLNVVKELGEKADKFSYQLFDVSKEENWEKFAEYLQENNISPDVLINNAGILPKFNRFGNYAVDYIKSAMDINFYSAVYSMHHLMPIILKSKKAAIINISSSAALCTLAGTSVYSASKAALKSLTEAVREEYRGECYTAIVCPGFTKTDIFSSQGKNAGFSNKAIEAVSSSCEGMVNKIVCGIASKRELMVFGIDSKLMNIGNRIAGVKTSMISSKIMKAAKVALFEDIFKK
ncbi:MAG: SDR family NAD(P)-dependent oxidoreductase [Oscillospiraceae bacterium]|nr:SDR family NAD(P)-dependent oxidoreductase [Oscillospiraceae bacterium]